jgi:hypothetical protein
LQNEILLCCYEKIHPTRIVFHFKPTPVFFLYFVLVLSENIQDVLCVRSVTAGEQPVSDSRIFDEQDKFAQESMELLWCIFKNG